MSSSVVDFLSFVLRFPLDEFRHDMEPDLGVSPLTSKVVAEAAATTVRRRLTDGDEERLFRLCKLEDGESDRI